MSQCQALKRRHPFFRSPDSGVEWWRSGRVLANFICVQWTQLIHKTVHPGFSGWRGKSFRPCSSIGSDGWSSWQKLILQLLEMLRVRQPGPCIDGQGPSASNPGQGRVKRGKAEEESLSWFVITTSLKISLFSAIKLREFLLHLFFFFLQNNLISVLSKYAACCVLFGRMYFAGGKNSIGNEEKAILQHCYFKHWLVSVVWNELEFQLTYLLFCFSSFGLTCGLRSLMPSYIFLFSTIPEPNLQENEMYHTKIFISEQTEVIQLQKKFC